jgi:hypothetical protein
VVGECPARPVRTVERCLACEADRSGPVWPFVPENTSLRLTLSRANNRDLPAVRVATPVGLASEATLHESIDKIVVATLFIDLIDSML